MTEQSKPESFLHIPVERTQKSTYVKAAQRQQMKLAQWVTQVLDNHLLHGSADSASSAGKWLPFNYETMEDSLVWVKGNRPVYDVDVDDDGRAVGEMTDETKPFVALVSIETYEGGDFQITPFDEYETGGYSDEYAITHYMPFTRPQ